MVQGSPRLSGPCFLLDPLRLIARLRCGGFFFALDPNIGLWNDKVNPNWRLTFTDPKTSERQRIPYAFTIQHRGPHCELAMRMQFGVVQCEGAFASPPQHLVVEDGWEVSIPLPLTGIRVCHTVLRADGAAGPVPVTVYCVDCFLGLGAGFQRARSGLGSASAPEALPWRGDVAMVGFVASAI